MIATAVNEEGFAVLLYCAQVLFWAA